VADSSERKLKVRDFKLWELERIAAGALAKAPQCIKAGRVNIERLLEEGHGVKLIAFQELARQWKTYAWIDTKSRYVFVDAELMDNVNEAKKYRFTLAEELAHLLIHTSIFAGCESVEARMAIEDRLSDEQKDRLENNAKALASMILMPEQAVRAFIEGVLPKFTDEQGHVLVDQLASAISREFDVNFRPAKRRLKVLGYHKSHGWDLD
jgi:Zn-dependent peptidase ImmA (M78 family)